MQTVARAWTTILLLAAATAACSNPAVSVIEDQAYSNGETLDIHRSGVANRGPAIVLLHGAGLDRTQYRPLADQLAADGAVVFNAGWGVLPESNEESLSQIACAVRYARTNASEYGADPDKVVLVGHSTAAAYAGQVAMLGDGLTDGCESEASALPDALVVISPAQVPGGAPWEHSALGANPDLRIAVIHGRDDEVVRPRLSERTVELLQDAGYEVSFDLVDGGHYGPVAVDLGEATDDASAERTVGIILGLLADS